MKHLIAAALICAALYTNAQTSVSPAAHTWAAATKASFPVHCFENRSADGSVVSLQFIEYFDKVVGILDYTYVDQDGAHGMFIGSLENNIIMASYLYTIEGSEQEEEIMIKFDEANAYKAVGELMEGEEGAMFIKNPSTVEWSETFKKISCQ